MTGVIGVVQARSGSSRLPGKVLADVGGQPMLALMLRRLQPAVGPVLDGLVVATSDARADDAVAAVAAGLGLPAVRGPEQDVLARFALALDAHPAEAVVRMTADCPLSDPGIVASVVDRFRSSGADYASNTLLRTYPDGLDVEVVAARALRDANASATDPAEREHVTPFVYRHPSRFRLAAALGPRRLGHLRWTVDTADDLEAVRAMVAGVADPTACGWDGFLAAGIGAPATQPVWARFAEEQDATPVMSLASAVAIGEPVDLSDYGRAVALALDSPSVRMWIVLDDAGRLVAHLDVRVEDGRGVLSGRALAGWEDRAIRAVRAVLSADLQVAELIVGAWDAGGA